ncbi:MULTISPECIES: DUF1178 family protein [unclassified Leisingera]|uniref:DUF1178 family protein n=1 Tax=unclassified Leisingera TaxID=2614906 RepID=UPI001012D1EB|nr:MULTISPECIES: DUF1178 family protein [unclassified Leisingera]MCF6431371.1 DUF1178 family protein [Leisingera sp. MMG026]QAX30469.1 DUF1178 family protein [Leisingera sp. NJS204]
MIQYSLKCTDGHRFDSWFQSAAAFDKLAAAGLVSCAVCGGAQVEKAIMAPRVRPGRKAVSAVGEPEPQAAAPAAPAALPAAAPAAAAGPGMLSRPAGAVEKAIADLRKKVEENSDYVGGSFVQEARAMHLGEAPERAIHGEAKLEDARELIEEGVPVMPLPFRPGRKTN